mmetsp:Transcript_4854/g.7481  ORF Transcript_4854/g.7481 Transcript_4854/m.7481 type:complete len:244 (+) Transcript_4854:100-831(+)
MSNSSHDICLTSSTPDKSPPENTCFSEARYRRFSSELMSSLVSSNTSSSSLYWDGSVKKGSSLVPFWLLSILLFDFNSISSCSCASSCMSISNRFLLLLAISIVPSSSSKRLLLHASLRGSSSAQLQLIASTVATRRALATGRRCFTTIKPNTSASNDRSAADNAMASLVNSSNFFRSAGVFKIPVAPVSSKHMFCNTMDLSLSIKDIMSFLETPIRSTTLFKSLYSFEKALLPPYFFSLRNC